MTFAISRRRFLSRAATASVAAAFSSTLTSARAAAQRTGEAEFHDVDFHVHLDNSTLDKILELSRERGIKFGIVEHAGTKENKYPTVLSNDDELRRYLSMLEGQQVFKGIQAEWTDWMGCFSRSLLAQLDYVLTDTMTFPGKDGQRVKLWSPEAPQLVDMSDKQAFMDRYVDWHLEIMAREPFDILANASWLPADMAEHYDLYWTPKRIKRVIDAALEYGIALEISSSFKLPHLPFLKAAKAAGTKFSFGSNGRYPNMGKLDYSFEMAKELDLKPSDLFSPAPNGQKAVQRRKF